MPLARRSSLALAALVAALAAGPARSEGTIVTTGASIAAGAGTPAGTVTIDPFAGPKTPPALPVIGGLGSIGTMTGSMPALPGGGTGALGAFSAAANTTQTLAGGTYDYSSYTVNYNAVVVYTGAVTIRTTGDVEIDGQVTSSANGASVTFLCGGDFRIPANQYGTTRDGIRTTGSSAPVTVDAAGSVTASSPDGSRSEIRSFSGLVTVLSHMSIGSAVLTNCDVRSAAGATVRARGAVTMSGAVFDVSSGDVLVQSFGSAALVADSTLSVFGNLTIEGAAGVSVTGTSDVHGEGVVAIRGFGDPAALGGAQDVVVDAASVSNFTALAKVARAVAAGSDLSILSAAGVRLSASAYVNNEGTGDIVITAFGGSVKMEVAGSGGQTDVCHGGTGDILVSATQDVVVAGSSLVDASKGAVRLSALAGSFRLLGDGLVHAGKGIADIRAGDSVTIAKNASTGISAPTIQGDAFSVSAGAGGIDASVADLTAIAGTGRVVASGAVKLRGSVTSTGQLTVQAIAGILDLAGAVLATVTDDVRASSAVVIESYSGAGTIDATNATIESGDSPVKSGDVTVALHSVPGPAVNSFFLPSRVTVKLNPSDKTKSALVASGVFDLGSVAPDLAGAATLTVGGTDFPVSLLAGKTGVLAHKDAAVDFQVVPAKSGTSKASFKLKCTGDFSGFLDDKGSGALLLRLANPALRAECALTLTAGKYAYGRTRGALAEPSFFLVKSKAKIAGAGKDSLQFVAGLATDGTTPAAAPDVRISFGTAFDLRIASAAFGAAVKDKFTAVNPAPGVSLVVLDYRKETITMKGTKLDIGSFDAGQSVPVSIGLSLDTDNRSVDLRMARKDAASFGY